MTEPELLLPTIRKAITLAEFPFVAARRENPRWDEAALRERILALGRWEYCLSFSHGLTTALNSTFDDDTVRFHRYRSKLVSGTGCELLGDDLASGRIADLACHCGVFSLDLAQRGAGHVTGLELRDRNLRQAEFLRDYYGISNVTFRQADLERPPALEADVVLCLGILYHVVTPIQLLEYCHRCCARFAVVETICNPTPIAGYVVVGGKNVQVATEGSRPVELQPTYRGVIASLRAVGFERVVEVVGSCEQPVPLFPELARRCFIAFKRE